MSQKFLLGWAVTASVIALLSLGALIGRSTGPDPAPTAARFNPANVDTSGKDAGSAGAVPAYSVPDIFTEMPGEWRSDTDNETFDGYAILFDPQRREVVVEQCRHRGYVDDNGTPRDTSYEFCDGVLWANILDIADAEATVADRNGNRVNLTFALREDGEQPTLSLSFPGHRMELIPGSKNDLLQAMDNTPRMIEEKKIQFEALQAQYRELQRAQQAASREQDIPTYTLPDRKPDEQDD